VSGVVVPGTRNLAAVYFASATPGYAKTRYFFLADGRVDVTNTVENPIYEYDAYVDGVPTKIKTRNIDLIGRQTIENVNTGLWAYDGNNDDVKIAEKEPGENELGVVDYINPVGAIGSEITYLGLNGAQSGIVCTTTTKYYEVEYFNGFSSRVEPGTIRPSSADVVYTVQGVERNNDGSASAVYFTITYLTGGIDAYIDAQVDFANQIQALYNDATADSITNGAGVAVITGEVTSINSLKVNPLATLPQKLIAANRLRGFVVNYTEGLKEAKAKVGAVLSGTSTSAIGGADSTKLLVNADLLAYFGDIFLYNGTSAAGTAATAFTWAVDNKTVTIKFVDGTIKSWTLTGEHS
jgi:hypothetical protein